MSHGISITRVPGSYDPNGPRITDPTLEPGFKNVFPIAAFAVIDRRGHLAHRTGSSGIYLGRKSVDRFAEGCDKVGMFAPYSVVQVTINPKEIK